MEDKILTNHLGGPLYLSRELFVRLTEDKNKLGAVNLLDELFSNPDEVWQLELEEPRYVWRYVKFYQEGVLFGIVDLADISELRIADWYFMDHDPDDPDANAQSAAIDAQRTGILKRKYVKK